MFKVKFKIKFEIISKLNFLFINAFYESKVKEQTNNFALNSTVFTLQL